MVDGDARIIKAKMQPSIENKLKSTSFSFGSATPNPNFVGFHGPTYIIAMQLINATSNLSGQMNLTYSLLTTHNT